VYQRAVEHPQNTSINWHDISLHGFKIFGFYSLVKCPSWKRTVPPRLVKFTAFYGTRRFITTFTWALHMSLSSARSIQSTPNQPIHCQECHLKCILLPKPTLLETCIYFLSDNPYCVEHKCVKISALGTECLQWRPWRGRFEDFGVLNWSLRTAGVWREACINSLEIRCSFLNFALETSTYVMCNFFNRWQKPNEGWRKTTLWLWYFFIFVWPCSTDPLI